MHRQFVSIVLMCAATFASAQTVSELRDSEVAAALRQVLEIAIDRAVPRLGQENGFQGNDAGRIPLPGSLQGVEPLMRKVGMGEQLDEFALGLNRAAEQALPHMRVALGNSARTLPFEAPRDVLSGAPDAATQRFRRVSERALTKRFQPIVAREMKRLKLHEGYDALANRGIAFGLKRQENAELDAHVAARALDGLFAAMAEEERWVRENPLESGRRLVKKVFGAVLPE